MLRNKLKITISLILLTFFCGGSVFSQEKNKIPLYTEFFMLKNVPTCPNGKFASGGMMKRICKDYRVGFYKIFNTLKYNLTRRGTIEIDARSNTLIITDTKESVNYFKEIILAYDYSEMYKISEEEYKEDLMGSACCGLVTLCPEFKN